MKNLAAAAVVAALISPFSGAFAAPLSNQGFESGLLGWTTLGDVSATASTSVTTFNSVVWIVNAYQTTMAQLNSNPIAISAVESGLGLAAGSLQAGNVNPNGGSLTDASAIYQDFSGTAGSTIQEFWNYVARDYIPFNDPAFAIMINLDTGIAEAIDVLASIQGLGVTAGTAGNTGWQTYSHTLATTGNYRLAFVTTNDKDTILDSALFLDNGAGSCVPGCPPIGVPEPGSLVLTAFGILGIAAVRRRWTS
jgi:hypothetical protein